jgi:NTP pyrophosphatase (non-canonical NTP hydrolase)
MMSAIREWCREVQAVSVAHGFESTIDNLPQRLMLVVSECAEALEAWRSRDDGHIGEELADIVIRTFEIAESLGFDLEGEMIRKNEKNKTRPFRHGGKRG